MACAAAALAAQSLTAQEKKCHRCEAVREYNAEHHKNFEYFDDYVISDDDDKDDDSNPFLKKGDTKATAGIESPKASYPEPVAELGK